jgi:hypothetical protein
VCREGHDVLRWWHVIAIGKWFRNGFVWLKLWPLKHCSVCVCVCVCVCVYGVWACTILSLLFSLHGNCMVVMDDCNMEGKTPLDTGSRADNMSIGYSLLHWAGHTIALSVGDTFPWPLTHWILSSSWYWAGQAPYLVLQGICLATLPFPQPFWRLAKCWPACQVQRN